MSKLIRLWKVLIYTPRTIINVVLLFSIVTVYIIYSICSYVISGDEPYDLKFSMYELIP